MLSPKRTKYSKAHKAPSMAESKIMKNHNNLSRGAAALAAHPNVRRTVYADGLMEVFETKDGTDIATVGAHLLTCTLAAKPADLPLSDLKTSPC